MTIEAYNGQEAQQAILRNDREAREAAEREFQAAHAGATGDKIGNGDSLQRTATNQVRTPGKPVRKSKGAALDPVPESRRFIRTCATFNGHRTLHFWRGEYYEWNGRSYAILSEDELRSRIYGYMDERGMRATRTAVADLLGAIQAAAVLSFRTEAPTWLRDEAPLPAGECLIAKNCVLHLPSMETLQLDPQLFSVNAVDYEFNSAAACPQWLRFLDGIWSDDPECIGTLQEVLGYLLLPDTSQQKIFLLVGPRRSGKGTIGRVIHSLIGKDNVCDPTLGQLQGEFGLQPLIAKTVAFIGDARLSGRHDASAIAERLLSISGEDAQTINRKHLPMVTVQLPTRFVVATNELPRFTDASATLPSRFVILNFTRSFYGREDHALTGRLKMELPGILNWAIAGYRRLNDRGFFVQPASADEALAEMEELSSPMTAFLRDCCEQVVGAQTPVDEIWTEWRRWCARTGRKEGTKQTFGRDLRAAASGVKVKQTRAFGGVTRVYEGLRLIPTMHSDFEDPFSDFSSGGVTRCHA